MWVILWAHGKVARSLKICFPRSKNEKKQGPIQDRRFQKQRPSQ